MKPRIEYLLVTGLRALSLWDLYRCIVSTCMLEDIMISTMTPDSIVVGGNGELRGRGRLTSDRHRTRRPFPLHAETLN